MFKITSAREIKNHFIQTILIELNKFLNIVWRWGRYEYKMKKKLSKPFSQLVLYLNVLSDFFNIEIKT